MTVHPFHEQILTQIIQRSGKATQHTFDETYLGNSHPRYSISSPVLREIAKNWAKANSDIGANEFTEVITSLISGPSFTEKCLGGILLDYATPSQRKFDINLFDAWLDHLQGWAEVDALCTGKYQLKEIPVNFKRWKPLLRKLNKSKLLEKQRASLVLLCSPISHSADDEMGETALLLIERLKANREILITKAISWLLRSMVRHHREKVSAYVHENAASLPAIAVRETRKKLDTGRKSG